MRTAWKAIPTLSRTCAHCCSGLSAAYGRRHPTKTGRTEILSPTGRRRPGLGTCILVASARAGTEVSFEMPWLQGSRIVRGVIEGDIRRETSSLASSIFSWPAGCRATGSSRVTIWRHQPRCRGRHLGRYDKAGTAVAGVTAAPGVFDSGQRWRRGRVHSTGGPASDGNAPTPDAGPR